MPKLTIKLLVALPFIIIPMMVTEQTFAAQNGENNSSYNLTGFFQQHFTYDAHDDNPTAFSNRLARIGLAGPVTDRISVNLVGGLVEPPDRNPQLVNAMVNFNIDPRLQIRTGQFLVPFGLEGQEPIFFHPAIDRSQVSQRINTHRIFRDIGVQASGTFGDLDYAVALINGTGANVTEDIDPKDVIGRVGYNPVEELEVGVSGHFGHYLPAGADDEESRLRAGVDAEWNNDQLQVRSEYLFRRDDLPEGGEQDQQGFYILGAYQINDSWQPLVRYEYHDPDTDMDDVRYTGITAGLNYYFQGDNRLSVNYEIRDDESNPNIDDLLTVQMQIVF